MYRERVLREKRQAESVVPFREWFKRKCEPLIDAYKMRYKKKPALNEALDVLRHSEDTVEVRKAVKKIIRLKDILTAHQMDELYYFALTPGHENWARRCAAADVVAGLCTEKPEYENKSKHALMSLLHSRDPHLIDSALHGMAKMRGLFKDQCKEVLALLCDNEDDALVAAGIRGFAELGETDFIAWAMFNITADEELHKHRLIIEAVGKGLITLAKQPERAQKILELVEKFRNSAGYAIQKETYAFLFGDIDEYLAKAEKEARKALKKPLEV